MFEKKKPDTKAIKKRKKTIKNIKRSLLGVVSIAGLCLFAFTKKGRAIFKIGKRLIFRKWI